MKNFRSFAMYCIGFDLNRILNFNTNKLFTELIATPNLRLFLLVIFGFVAVIFTGVVVLLAIAQITEFKPVEIENLKTAGKDKKENISDSILTLLSWNIGYAGMGAETDFFYDGGKMVRPSLQLNQRYMKNIQHFLSENISVDFILIQEADKQSRRSYHHDQTEILQNTLPDHSSVFAVNYKVLFVPAPIFNPLGKVTGGLMSFSRYQPAESLRIGFQKDYPLPTRLFTLKRCFILQRFAAIERKELVLINTHNSAFDDGGLREHQLQALKETALQEYEKGNWVIIGGDWNMNPPGFNPQKITNGDVSVKNEMGSIRKDFMPKDWSWIYDETAPTNREVVEAYVKGQTPTSIIDFFLVSPNIKILAIKTHDKAFANSDHNPVFIKVQLFEMIVRAP
jgi:endonuclease/exonuclease/phosphatase family metal-dependent hydrolase